MIGVQEITGICIYYHILSKMSIEDAEKGVLFLLALHMYLFKIPTEALNVVKQGQVWQSQCRESARGLVALSSSGGCAYPPNKLSWRKSVVATQADEVREDFYGGLFERGSPPLFWKPRAVLYTPITLLIKKPLLGGFLYS